ncbi:ABC transporter ATP-binding protein [Shouchella miscanthi]|uniref:ABC transporter ATP-binding protein n=1 Tax=Shouchella miscanthi TaxID=2598861 RepID=UPI001643953B|nr:ABC transporter ATP-binding protein [Shouchella miscanthi]
MKNHVELNQLCKSYDGQTFVIEDVGVTIHEGEFFVLVGPSGCGKSTLLRMIAGLEKISAGELKLYEKIANHLSPSERELSMVFQNYALYPHLTVKENIVFGLKVRKVKKLDREARCIEAAEMLGLIPYLDRKPRELSGGQRQRVALARAVVSKTKLCLMDEPLSNLDAKLRAQMRTEIRHMQQKVGMTMVYVTHDQVEAMTMGDRIMVLRDGIVQQIGSPLAIYNNPVNRFVATFIGSPPMNVSRATIDRVNGSIYFAANQVIQLTECELKKLSGDTIFVGVRPECIGKREGMERPISLEVEVDSSELLGNETVISFSVGESVWKATWSGQWRHQQGEKISISFSQDKLFLFDCETEETLLAPSFRDEVVHLGLS